MQFKTQYDARDRIESKRTEPSGIMITKLQKTTICPLTRVVNAAAGTLSAGQWNESGTRILVTMPFNRSFTIIWAIAEHLQIGFAVFFRTNANSINRVVTTHIKITTSSLNQQTLRSP